MPAGSNKITPLLALRFLLTPEALGTLNLGWTSLSKARETSAHHRLSTLTSSRHASCQPILLPLDEAEFASNELLDALVQWYSTTALWQLPSLDDLL